jgi:serine/threonine-protein kinase
MKGPSMVGASIGTYRLAEALGDGGVGEVYRAVEGSSGKEAAFRVFARDVSGDPMLADRLRSMAPALKKLHHPNIGAVYELVSVGPDLALFLEYVPGATLEQVRRQSGRLETSVSVSCAVQILRALESAHGRGILHHALRPTNVMVTRAGTAKVLDFGIGHAFGANRKTREDRLLEVLAYLAPEQIQNQPGDARSDLYSVGVMLYEMLTGRLPFDHRSEFALRQAHLSEPPASPRFLVPELPEWLDQAILRALAKHPTSRYQNATEFRAVLEAALGLSTSREAAIVRQRSGAPADTFGAAPPIPGPSASTGRTSGVHEVGPIAVRPAAGTAGIGGVPPAKAHHQAPTPTWTGASASGSAAPLSAPASAPTATLAAAPAAAPGVPSALAAAPAPATVPAPASAAIPAGPGAGIAVVLVILLALAAAGAYLWKRGAFPLAPPEPTAATEPGAAAPSQGTAPTPVAAKTVPPARPAAKPVPGSKAAAKPPLVSKPLPPIPHDAPLAVAGQAAVAPAKPTAGAAVDETGDRSFRGVKLVTQEGAAERTSDVVLIFGRDGLSVNPGGGDTALRSVRYGEIVRASYTKAEKKRLGVIPSAQHVLTIETGGEPLLLRLDKDVVDAILAALEARSGRAVGR